MNPQGDEQKLMDVYADEVVTALLVDHGRVCTIVSEEHLHQRTPVFVGDRSLVGRLEECLFEDT